MPEWIDNAKNDGITRRDFLDGVAITAAGLRPPLRHLT